MSSRIDSLVGGIASTNRAGLGGGAVRRVVHPPRCGARRYGVEVERDRGTHRHRHQSVQPGAHHGDHPARGVRSGERNGPAATSRISIRRPRRRTADQVEAAVVMAAHRALTNYFTVPATVALLNAARDSDLATIADGPAKVAGMAVGVAAANAMIALRLTDGSATAPLTNIPSPAFGRRLRADNRVRLRACSSTGRR